MKKTRIGVSVTNVIDWKMISEKYLTTLGEKREDEWQYQNFERESRSKQGGHHKRRSSLADKGRAESRTAILSRRQSRISERKTPARYE